jgi:hypothetical protein
MSYGTYSVSTSSSFTVTHARHLAAKVATDLKRIQRLYGSPSDQWIADYEAEITEMLKAEYLGTVWYGFRKSEQWIEPTLKYTARDLAMAAGDDDDPGRVRPGASVAGASFYSYMTYSPAWDQLLEADKEKFRVRLPFTRAGAPEPTVAGYLTSDRTYSAGGKALDRASVRSY